MRRVERQKDTQRRLREGGGAYHQYSTSYISNRNLHQVPACRIYDSGQVLPRAREGERFRVKSVGFRVYASSNGVLCLGLQVRRGQA